MLEVQTMPVSALEPYENNAKIHTKEQVEQICASIREFGFNDPIAIWGYEIVEGHGRLMAAKELGMEEVPVIRLDHLTDEQRRAYTHVHNQLTMNTGFDWAVLDEELANLDFDFEEFGFETFDAEAEDEDDGRYSKELGKVVYEPKDTAWQPFELYDSERSDELLRKVETVEDMALRHILEKRAQWFVDFRFDRIADYYAYQATPEEQRVFEALGLVLLDRGARGERVRRPGR